MPPFRNEYGAARGTAPGVDDTTPVGMRGRCVRARACHCVGSAYGAASKLASRRCLLTRGFVVLGCVLILLRRCLQAWFSTSRLTQIFHLPLVMPAREYANKVAGLFFHPLPLASSQLAEISSQHYRAVVDVKRMLITTAMVRCECLGLRLLATEPLVECIGKHGCMDGRAINALA